MCAKIAYGFWKNRSTISSLCSLSCENNVRKWHPHREKSAYTREYCFCCRKCAWNAIDINSLPFLIIEHFREHRWDEFSIKTLVWCHTKSNWFRSWSQLTIQCVFASLNGPAIDLQKIPILVKKNHLSRSFWSWRVCIQPKLSHLRHRKPARIHWKAETPKTSYYLVRIFV